MGDCGCGCGGAGNCDDNLNSKVLSSQVSGNVSYDGANFICTKDSSINVNTGDGLNSVIQKMLSKLCGGSGNYFRKKVENVTATGAVQDFDLGQDLFNVSELKAGEGVRIRIFGTFSSVNAVAGIDMKLMQFGDDGAGTVTSPSSIMTMNVAQGVTGARFSIEYEVYRKNDGTDTLQYSGKMDTQDTANKYLYHGTVSNPPTATFGLGFIFTVAINDVADNVNVNYMTFEHIRP